ncbi:MAG: hypothetical protein AAGA11_16560 [Pseudomonadota bacterium]
MEYVGVLLFFGGITLFHYSQEEFLGVSEETWKSISLTVFSSAFLVFGWDALSSGRIAFYLFDNPLLSFTVKREEWPSVFYTLTAATFCVGLIGWLNMFKTLYSRN